MHKREYSGNKLLYAPRELITVFNVHLNFKVMKLIWTKTATDGFFIIIGEKNFFEGD